LTTWLDATPATGLGAIDVSQLVLFESQLDPHGSIYATLASLKMGTS
jgi:hypothetical protein